MPHCMPDEQTSCTAAFGDLDLAWARFGSNWLLANFPNGLISSGEILGASKQNGCTSMSDYLKAMFKCANKKHVKLSRPNMNKGIRKKTNSSENNQDPSRIAVYSFA